MSKIMIGTDEVLKVMFGLDEVSSLAMGGETIPITPPTPPAPVYSAMPFTIEVISGGNFTINKAVDYSLDGGDTWTTTTGATTLNFNSGDTVQIKRQTSNASSIFTGNTAITFNTYGNIMSLVYGDNFVGETSVFSNQCFYSLFSNSSVVDAGNLVLPTGLYDECFSSMFKGCSNLTTAPEILATTLEDDSCGNMFVDCRNLNYIKCMATDISATNCLYNWVKRVSSSGTFVKAAGVSWPSGNSGIPTGWTVVDA